MSYSVQTSTSGHTHQVHLDTPYLVLTLYDRCHYLLSPRVWKCLGLKYVLEEDEVEIINSLLTYLWKYIYIFFVNDIHISRSNTTKGLIGLCCTYIHIYMYFRSWMFSLNLERR